MFSISAHKNILDGRLKILSSEFVNLVQDGILPIFHCLNFEAVQMELSKKLDQLLAKNLKGYFLIS